MLNFFIPFKIKISLLPIHHVLYLRCVCLSQVMAELHSLHPILTRADSMTRDNTSSFGALGMLLVKGVLAYVLLRLGRSQEGLEVKQKICRLLVIGKKNVFFLWPSMENSEGFHTYISICIQKIVTYCMELRGFSLMPHAQNLNHAQSCVSWTNPASTRHVGS